MQKLPPEKDLIVLKIQGFHEIKCYNITSKKTGCLIDYISVLPAVATKAAAHKSICYSCARMKYSIKKSNISCIAENFEHVS